LTLNAKSLTFAVAVAALGVPPLVGLVIAVSAAWVAVLAFTPPVGVTGDAGPPRGGVVPPEGGFVTGGLTGGAGGGVVPPPGWIQEGP
jgi:hypothetical protein